MLFTRHRVTLFLLHIFFVTIALAQQATDAINYSLTNKKLSAGLNLLINEYDVPILYINQAIDTLFVSAQCEQCSRKEALNNLLEQTTLTWKNVKGQFIIYDSSKDEVFQPSDMAKESNYSIEGFIIDSISNEPLPYATIAIKGTGKGVVADSSGYFSIPNLSPKSYQLKILYVGYHADSLIADLSLRSDIKIKQIKLNPKNIELDAIIIRKPRIHTMATINKASVVVFDPLRLKTTPTMDQGDIVQNIRLASGVNIIPDDPMGVNLRGGSSDQTLILFDKIPIYHTQHLMGFNGLLNANCAQKIALHSGGFSAQYGDRLSGVLDIQGKSESDKKIGGGISANIYTLRGYANVPITKKANVYVTLNKSTDWFGIAKNFLLRSDYSYFNLYDQVKYSGKYGTGFYVQGLSGADYQVSATDFMDVTTKASYSISQKDTIKVTLLYSTDKVDIKNTLENGEQKTGERAEEWESKGINVNYQRSWLPGLTSSLGFVQSEFENNTGFGYFEDSLARTDFNNNNQVSHREGYLNFDYRIHKILSCHAGVVYSEIETELSRFDQSENVFVQSFFNQVKNRKLTLFSELKLKPLDKLSMNIGLRFNKIPDLNLQDFEPRISVKSELNSYFSISLAGGIYHQYMHRTPSVVAYNMSSIGPTGSWIYSQKNLNPSKALHALAGLNFDSKWVSIHALAYYKRYSDLHLIIPSQMKIAYIDNADRIKRSLYIDWIKNREIIMSGDHEIDIFSGHGNSRGFEFIASKNKGIYTGFISYHLSRTEFQFPYMNVGQPFIPSYDHTHEIKTMNYFSYYNLNVGNIIYLVSGKPYPNKYPYKSYFDSSELSIEHPINWEMQTNERLPMYFNTDVSISYDLNKFKKFKGTFGVVMQNVFNTKQLISKYYTWVAVDGSDEPVLELQDQYSQGRLFNVFLSIDF